MAAVAISLLGGLFLMSSSCQNTDPGWQVHQWVCWLLPFRAACRNHRNCELRTSTDGERRPCVSYITKTGFSKLWWGWHFIFGSLALELYDFYLQGNGFQNIGWKFSMKMRPRRDSSPGLTCGRSRHLVWHLTHSKCSVTIRWVTK